MKTCRLVILLLSIWLPHGESTCPAPSVADGTVTPTGTINSGAVYTVTCNTGYKIDGSLTVTCSETSGAATLSNPPTCITTPTCAQPIVADGIVSPAGPINSGAVYTVTCNTGYKIDGSLTVTCSETSGAATLSKLPTCITTPCAKPTVPNGEVSPTTGTVAHGQEYQLTCNQGYLPKSLTSLECDGSTGDLTPESLECEVDNKTEPNTTCAAPSVANGVVSPAGPINSDASYTVTCNTGYKTSGSPTVNCTDKDGVATLDQLPTCLPEPIESVEQSGAGGMSKMSTIGAIILIVLYTTC